MKVEVSLDEKYPYLYVTDRERYRKLGEYLSTDDLKREWLESFDRRAVEISDELAKRLLELREEEEELVEKIANEAGVIYYGAKESNG